MAHQLGSLYPNRRLERHYFAATNGDPEVNLKEVAEGWIQRAR
jgi:hypothetical protein